MAALSPKADIQVGFAECLEMTQSRPLGQLASVTVCQAFEEASPSDDNTDRRSGRTRSSRRVPRSPSLSNPSVIRRPWAGSAVAIRRLSRSAKAGSSTAHIICNPLARSCASTSARCMALKSSMCWMGSSRIIALRRCQEVDRNTDSRNAIPVALRCPLEKRNCGFSESPTSSLRNRRTSPRIL